MPRRLTVLTQSYPPEPLPVTRWVPRALADEGWDVTVVTGVPNYPSGVVYPGYRATMLSREEDGPLHVRRTPLYASHDTNALRRMLNYTSWAISATFFGWREMRRSDVNLVYSTPATCALPAMVSKWVTGKPYVLLIEDVWPDSVFSSGFLTAGLISRIANWGLTAFCQSAYRHSDHVAVIAPGMIDLLASRGVPREKLSLVYNWVEEDVFHPQPADPDLRRELGLGDDDFLVMFAGNHGLAQKLDVFIEAIGQIPATERVHAVLIGNGVAKPELQELAARVAPDRVHFLDPRPLAAMPAAYAAADLQYAGLANDHLFAITLPSKVTSALAVGAPILVAIPGNAAEVVGQAEAGWVAKAEDAADIAEKLIQARHAGRPELSRRADNGRRFYERAMSAAVGARRLSDILAESMRKKGGRHV